VVTRRAGGAPFDPANVQALCRSHHSQKTARRDRPAYRASGKPLRAKGCDADGRPADPLHPWSKSGSGRAAGPAERPASGELPDPSDRGS